MYQVVAETYNPATRYVFRYTSFETAIAVYDVLNKVFVNPEWTRHGACESEVCHMSHRANLFNEGALTLNEIDV